MNYRNNSDIVSIIKHKSKKTGLFYKLVSCHQAFIIIGGIMKGSCVCGKVTYEITPPFKTFQYCHCSRCRKFTGSAQASNLFVPPSQFQWLQGNEHVGRYEHPDAKERA